MDAAFATCRYPEKPGILEIKRISSSYRNFYSIQGYRKNILCIILFYHLEYWSNLSVGQCLVVNEFQLRQSFTYFNWNSIRIVHQGRLEASRQEIYKSIIKHTKNRFAVW